MNRKMSYRRELQQIPVHWSWRRSARFSPSQCKRPILQASKINMRPVITVKHDLPSVSGIISGKHSVSSSWTSGKRLLIFLVNSLRTMGMWYALETLASPMVNRCCNPYSAKQIHPVSIGIVRMSTCSHFCNSFLKRQFIVLCLPQFVDELWPGYHHMPRVEIWDFEYAITILSQGWTLNSAEQYSHTHLSITLF